MIVVNGFSLSNRTLDFSHERELRIGDGAARIYDDGAIVRVLALDPEVAKDHDEFGLKRCAHTERVIPEACRGIQ
jgi:hypothetical protein